MATYSKLKLSGSTDGRLIKVTTTATPGTTIHTAHATALDEITVLACNTDTTDRKLTIEYGGTTAPDDLIELTIPAESGLIPVLTLVLTNSCVVKAFAATGSVINIGGWVNRITP